MVVILRVLFVEDSESDVELITGHLQMAGYNVESERVVNLEEMKAALLKHSWDIVFSNYQLSNFDATTALLICHEFSQDTPFIIITNDMPCETVVASIKAGAHDFLTKDNLSRLLPVVTHELNESKIRRAKQLALNTRIESEKRYRSFFENGITCNYLSDAEGQLIDFNPAFMKMLGYETEKELSGIHISELLTDPQGLITIVARLKKERNIESIEHEWIRQNGRRLFCIENITGIFSKEGELEYLLGYMIDVTERKEYEANLFRSKGRLTRGESVSKSGNWELHLDTGMIYGSEGAQNLYGIDAENWKLDNIRRIPLPQYRELLDNSLSQLIKFGIPYNIEFKIRHQKSGEIIDIKSIAEYDSKGKILFGVIQDITDRKDSEAKLISSEHRFRELANSLPVCVYETDLSGNVTFVNATMLLWFGYEEKDLGDSLNVFKFVPDFELKRLTDRFKQIITLDIHTSAEYTVKRKDGTFFPVLISSSAIKKDGEIVGVRGTMVDISERKKTESKLKNSQQTLTNLISNLPGFVYRCKNDKDWTMEYLSEGFTTITGYSVDEVMKLKSLTYNDIIQHDYRDHLFNRWQVLLKIKSPLEEEYPIITKGGEIRWVWERGRGIYDDEGRLIYLEGFIADITDRKRAEQIRKVLYNISTAVITTQDLEELIETIRNQLGTLLDTRNFYLAFYDEANGMFYTPHAVDQMDNLESWPAEKSLTGYLIKQKNALLVSEEEYWRLVENDDIQVVGTPSKLWLGVPLYEEDKIIGAFVVQSYDNPNAYTPKDVEMLEFISHQISLFVQRKRAEGKLKSALLKAEESDKLKSAFLATMNHELRTPLNHILGFSELILAGVMPEDNQSFASSIYSSGKNLLAIVEDVFDLALAEQANVKLRLQTFRLMDQFMENKSSFDHILQSSGKAEQIQLVFRPDTRLLSLYLTVDRSKVNQILINLFKNAVKFTNSGTIEFGYQSNEPGKLTFFIKDSGIGIPKEKQTVIFDFFRQVDDSPTREYGGIGIGLAISQKIAKILKGELSVISEPDHGSAFYLTVPVELADVGNPL